LRTRALLGALTFANFSVLWTSMAFLLAAPPYRYSEAMIGLFGLVGAAGALAANRAGRLADQGKSSKTTSACLLLLLASWLPIWLGQHAIAALVIGIIVLDLAVQAIHVTNQAMIYRMMPEARSRLTAGYMTSYFLGGALGSVLSASAFQQMQWSGVALVGVALSALNLLVWHLGKVDDGVDAEAAG
jgi:predicted MFS family arabinose efflux permease